MPRVSREQFISNRTAITEASARLLRERGIKGLSVSELMAAAGLTHGGFYGHFASKDALAAEACSLAFEHSAQRWRTRAAAKGDPDSARASLIEAYLSARSRNSAGASCPTAALAGDVAREDAHAPIRAAFASGIERLIQILGSLEQSGESSADRREALADFSAMVGALILARATAGLKVSDELLQASRERLSSPRKEAARRPRRTA